MCSWCFSIWRSSWRARSRAFQTLATKSILRTGFGDERARTPFKWKECRFIIIWTYGELQDKLMTEFILLRLPCVVIINPHKRYYSIRYGKIPLEVDPLRKFFVCILVWKYKTGQVTKSIWTWKTM